jgi:hypothetical protein
VRNPGIKTLRALVIVVVVSACSTNSSVDSSGPLGTTAAVNGKACIPVATPTTVTLGGEELQNSGHDPITIDAISIDGAQRISVADSVVVPIVNNTLLGFANNYPPDGASSTAQNISAWSKRAPAVGYQLSPGTTMNLVLAVKYLGGGDASADRITVAYHQGEKKYSLGFLTAYELKAKCF